MNPDDNKMSQGAVQMNATDGNGNVTTLSTYSADSGPHGVGCIPNGNYTASAIDATSQNGMVRNDVGFKVTLSDNTSKCRDDLRIHPDGNKPGTKGCIGLTETKENLKDFQSKMGAFLKDGTKINVNVNINNNPNYSDCDANGHKVHKDTPKVKE
jgi:hypothetical protein